jgi:hypothetical protein
MAKLRCNLQWDGNQVVTTYTVLGVEPNDLIELVTNDPEPFILECPNERLARKLGLTGARNPVAGRPELYQISQQTLSQGHAIVANGNSSGKSLKCGTLINGQYESWGGTGFSPPDDGI